MLYTNRYMNLALKQLRLIIRLYAGYKPVPPPHENPIELLIEKARFF